MSLPGIRFSFVVFIVFLTFVFNYSVANASTIVRGELTANTIWSKSASPYLATSVIVPLGKTLTIEPGVHVKLQGDLPLYVHGTLTVGKEDEEEVVITSYKDDAVAGDTNNDGNTTQPGDFDWCSIGVHSNAVLNITNTSIRYGGCSARGQIHNLAGTLTISHSKLLDSGGYGVLAGSSKTTSVTDTEISGADIGVRYHAGSLVLKNNNIHDNADYGVSNTSLRHTMVDATGNWWGSEKGPFHATLNPGGLGNNAVSDFITFDPWLAQNPLEQIPLCVENCFSNVLFLPGLEASRLYKDGVKLWEPHGDSDTEDLQLDADGKSVQSDIVTKDVLDKAYVPVKGNVYNAFLGDMESWKNTEGLIADYAAVPYDWRLSLSDIVNNGTKEGEYISYTHSSASPYIIEELRRLAGTSKSGKVTIIAHSNGGLVAKALTNKLGPEAADLIDKIILIAVPQSGTPQAIGGLLHGYKQGLPTELVDFYFSPKAARKLGANMPGAYHLLPSDAYFNGEGSGVDTPVITFKEGSLTQPFIDTYGNKIDNSSELHDFLLDNRGKVDPSSSNIGIPAVVNSGLLSYSENVHQPIDNSWSVPSPIFVYQIAGFGEDTVGTIEYWTGKKCVKNLGKWCLEYAPALQYTPKIVVDGDGTVVAPSALAMSEGEPNTSRWWVNLFKYNDENIDRKHASFLEVPELRSFIKENIITQKNSSLPTFISGSTPSTDFTDRLRFFLHSPLALSARDSVGNEISASLSTLPGGRYERFGEVQYISVPAASAPTIVLDGEEEGSFTLEVQEITEDNIEAVTTFEAIPSSADTKVTMDFPDGTIENAEPLKIDYDGDRVIDFSLEPKADEIVTVPPLDQTPPEARVFFNSSDSSLVVEGIDEGGPVTVSFSTASSEGRKDAVKKSTTTVTFTDQAGNISVLVYSHLFPSRERIESITLESVSYNGVVNTFFDTALKYKWNTEKKFGSYKTLAAFLKTPSKKVESHFRPKKNITVIMTKPQELNDLDQDDEVDGRPIREKFPGVIIPSFETKEGDVLIRY